MKCMHLNWPLTTPQPTRCITDTIASSRRTSAILLGVLQQPRLCRAAEMFSTVTDVKGVASPSLPTSAATLLIRHSTR